MGSSGFGGGNLAVGAAASVAAVLAEDSKAGDNIHHNQVAKKS
jgi:hypothetical protein